MAFRSSRSEPPLRIVFNMLFFAELYKGKAMKKVLTLAVLLAGLFFCISADHAYAQAKVSILQTGSLSGHLFACPT